jgi:hypothetical protein
MAVTSRGNEYTRSVLFGLAAGIAVKKLNGVQKLKKTAAQAGSKACFIA